jgi:cell division protein FtsQ
MLGRDADAAEARLVEFIKAYPSTVARVGRKHEYVDLRYPNGFAVRLPELDS